MKTNVVLYRQMGDFEVQQLSNEDLVELSTDLTISNELWYLVMDEKDRRITNSDRYVNSDIIVTTLDEAFRDIITSMPSSLIAKMFTESTIKRDYSAESYFFQTLANITNIDIKLQYQVGRYRVDAVLIESINNYGEYNIDKDAISKITCFEFDESHHDKPSNRKKDMRRHADILWELKDCFDIIEFYRIPEDKANEFLLHAIPYYGNIENSYCGDKLHEYSFAIDMGYINSFGGLIDEMRKIYHKQNTKF